jgi:hypothetical protein
MKLTRRGLLSLLGVTASTIAAPSQPLPIIVSGCRESVGPIWVGKWPPVKQLVGQQKFPDDVCYGDYEPVSYLFDKEQLKSFNDLFEQENSRLGFRVLE